MIENTETNIKLLQARRLPLLTRFNTLLNRADSITVTVPDSFGLHAIETGYRKDSLLTQHPMLKALDLKIQSAQAQEEVAKKMGLPGIGVGVDYVLVGERMDMNVPDNGQNVLMPMVTKSLPIFRGKYKAAVKEAQFTQSAIASSKKDFENNLVSSYEMTWFELERALQLIELYREQITKTEQVIELLLTAYSNSGQDFEEILRMQQQLLQFQMAETIAFKDYYTAIAKLDYLTAKIE